MLIKERRSTNQCNLCPRVCSFVGVEWMEQSIMYSIESLSPRTISSQSVYRCQDSVRTNDTDMVAQSVKRDEEEHT